MATGQDKKGKAWKTLLSLPLKIWRGAGGLQRWLLTAAVLAVAVLLGALLYTLWNTLRSDGHAHEVTLQPSIVTLEEVRPRGELYVCTAVVEDYVIRRATEMHVGLFPESHSCVQVLKQKVSFKIDLDKVCYTPDTLNVLLVELPPVQYVASTQDSPFLSDDEDFWEANLPSTNGMKREVEGKIRRRFDTEANRRKALRYAEAAIGDLLWKLGYEARFTPSVDMKRE